MPYLTAEKRAVVEERGYATDGAELNYMITKAVNAFFTRGRFATARQPRYADYAEALAALEGAKIEFVRRHLVPYEERKRQENGDV